MARRRQARPAASSPAPARPAGSSPPRIRRWWVDLAWMAGLGLLALFLRFTYLWRVKDSPLFLGLGLDARFYDRWAKEIAFGNWLGNEPFFMGPLYPYFLALVYLVAGPHPFAARVAQAFVGSLLVVLVALLGRELAGRRGAVVAGLMAAFYGPYMLFDGEILFPVLQVPLVAGSLLLLLQAQRADREGSDRELRVSSRGRPGGGASSPPRWMQPGKWFGAGLLLALAAIGNASVLAFAPVAAVWAWWAPGGTEGGRPARSRNLRGALLFLAGVMVAVLPVAARNYAVGRDFVLITSNAGLNLYIGNSAESSGAYVKPRGLDVERDPEGRLPAQQALARPLKPSEVSDWWAGRARQYMREHPGRAASLWLKKFTLFWGNYEVPQIENYLFQRRYSPLLRLPFPTFGSLLGLAVMGAVFLVGRLRAVAPLLLFPVVHSLVVSSFFVVGRYRVSAVPALMALAAAGLVGVAGRLRRGNVRSAAITTGVGALVFAATLANPFGVRRDSGFAQCYYREGVELDRAGKTSEAEQALHKSLALDPSYPPAHVNLGSILGRRGETEGAAREFAEALRLDPDYPLAYYNLGALHEGLGQLEEAALSYGRASALDPGRLDAREGLGRVYYLKGDLAAAEEKFRALASAAEAGSDPRLRMRLGMYLERIERRKVVARELAPADGGDSWRALLRADVVSVDGPPEELIPAYKAVVEARGPAAVRAAALYELGVVAYSQRDLARARADFEQAASLCDGLPLVHFALGNVEVLQGNALRGIEEFRREVSFNPRHGASWLNLGVCYENALGDIPRAIDAYQRYVALGEERAEEIRARVAALQARGR